VIRQSLIDARAESKCLLIGEQQDAEYATDLEHEPMQKSVLSSTLAAEPGAMGAGSSPIALRWHRQR
jgi:hypothetical protein